MELYTKIHGVPKIAEPQDIRSQLTAIIATMPEQRFTPSFLWNEWNDIVDARQIDS